MLIIASRPAVTRSIFWFDWYCRQRVLAIIHPIESARPPAYYRIQACIPTKELRLQSGGNALLRKTNDSTMHFMPITSSRRGLYTVEASMAAKELDRSAFERTVALKALLLPKQECHRYMKLLKRHGIQPAQSCMRYEYILIPSFVSLEQPMQSQHAISRDHIHLLLRLLQSHTDSSQAESSGSR